MATEARRAAAAQRAFVADASHQLRSPLTALKLRLENLHSRLPGDAVTELDAAIEETDRLGALVNDLLQLARADDRPRRAVVDLARLSADRVDTWTAVAEAAPGRAPHRRSRRAGHRRGRAGRDRADPRQPPRQRTHRLASRLDDHRCHHLRTARASAPHQRRRRRLDDEQKVLATRRFWRASTSGDGTGLGLAIVDALATASGGNLDLADAPGGGLTVSVSFPAGAHSPGPLVR